MPSTYDRWDSADFGASLHKLMLVIETENFDLIARFVLFIRDAWNMKLARNAVRIYRKDDSKTDMHYASSNVALSDGYRYVTD
jgi:hypothetical protein